MPKKLTNEIFAGKGERVHPGKYGYALANYIDNKTHVIIICFIHGNFYITPHHFLSGQGCRKCGIAKRSLTLSKTFQCFLDETFETHAGLYDYSLVVEEYKNAHMKIPIVCFIHGIFYQTPDKHCSSGQGCPRCKSSKNEEFTRIAVEEIFGNKIKIKPQKKFDTSGRMIKNSILVDFYFELDGKKYIVEYNGEQHYEPVRFRSISQERAEENFANQQKRDEFLRDMCLEKNIILIEIDGRKITGKIKIEKFLRNILEKEILELDPNAEAIARANT